MLFRSDYGDFFRSQVPLSLGFLRHMCKGKAVSTSLVLDNLDSYLDFGGKIRSGGFEIPPPTPFLGSGSDSSGFPMHVLAWFQLTVEQFAVPLGLVYLTADGQVPQKGWYPRQVLQKILISATPLIECL